MDGGGGKVGQPAIRLPERKVKSPKGTWRQRNQGGKAIKARQGNDEMLLFIRLRGEKLAARIQKKTIAAAPESFDDLRRRGGGKNNNKKKKKQEVASNFLSHILQYERMKIMSKGFFFNRWTEEGEEEEAVLTNDGLSQKQQRKNASLSSSQLYFPSLSNLGAELRKEGGGGGVEGRWGGGVAVIWALRIRTAAWSGQISPVGLNLA